MVDEARNASVDDDVLAIHSAYRSVAWQRHIFDYWVEERRKDRGKQGLPEVSTKELRRMQLKWTAAPGRSAHHTGFAIDLKLYELGKKDCKRHPAYSWLAKNARRFGFYPYFPEGWHWEYNPPGLVEQLRQLRDLLGAGEDHGKLLEPPTQIPIAEPAFPSKAAIA
jgi:LAS superfamily LD-carboxypeptidase LdcB